MEDVGKFYGHLVYFTDIKYILWTLGIFYSNLVYFSRFSMLCQEKYVNPGWVKWITRDQWSQSMFAPLLNLRYVQFEKCKSLRESELETMTRIGHLPPGWPEELVKKSPKT
jgi:hypothetical protein